MVSSGLPHGKRLHGAERPWNIMRDCLI